MEVKELEQLQNAAQQSCDRWANILGLQQWNIVIKVLDEDENLRELPKLEYALNIASAKISLVTGEVWKKLYPDFWAPYNMEVHIVAQLLTLLLIQEYIVDLVTPSIYHLARIIIGLNDRAISLQNILENMQHQVEQENVQAPEERPEVVEAEPVDEENDKAE